MTNAEQRLLPTTFPSNPPPRACSPAVDGDFFTLAHLELAPALLLLHTKEGASSLGMLL